MKLSDVPIFVINLEISNARKNKMKNRLEHHGLESNSTFIKAIYKKDEEVKIYGKDYPRFSGESLVLGEIACMRSHLKAIQTFLTDSDSEYAIIMEDDVMFHNNFRNLFNEHMLHLPEDKVNLIMLSKYVSSYKEVEDVNNYYTTIGPQFFGGHCYMISRDYSKKAIELYDHPFSVLYEKYKTNITSEMITTHSDGYSAIKQLAIEDSFDSIISDNQEWRISCHLNYYSSFGINNYDEADKLLTLK